MKLHLISRIDNKTSFVLLCLPLPAPSNKAKIVPYLMKNYEKQKKSAMYDPLSNSVDFITHNIIKRSSTMRFQSTVFKCQISTYLVEQCTKQSLSMLQTSCAGNKAMSVTQ